MVTVLVACNHSVSQSDKNRLAESQKHIHINILLCWGGGGGGGNWILNPVNYTGVTSGQSNSHNAHFKTLLIHKIFF